MTRRATYSKSTSAPALSELTVGQIRDLQRKSIILAVGRYQAIGPTLQAFLTEKNIPSTTVFNSSLQEQLGDWLIAGKRPKIGRFVNGDSSVTVEEAQLELAKEFASVPVPYTLYRPKGAGGKTDPGGPVQKGQSYYYGLAGNNAASSIEKYQNALLQAKAARSLDSLKAFIARGEGTYDALNTGRAGDTSTYSPNYYKALAGAGSSPVPIAANPTVPPVVATTSPPITQPVLPNTTTPSVSPISAGQQQNQQFIEGFSAYVNRIYIAPLEGGKYDSVLLNDRFQQFRNSTLRKSPVNYGENSLSNNTVLLVDSDLNGDLLLIDGINSVQVKKEEEIKSITDDKLKAFTPDAKYALMNSRIFEMFPDSMRNKMSENSKLNAMNPSYSHAWRAPGKLSVTADFTIPGISGLRVGQIFWIDRISEAYRQYGAFQLFGLTEKIDASGWTTSIHSRFNALPRRSGANTLYDSTSKPTGNTAQTPTQGTPTAEAARQAISQVRINF